MAVSDYLNQVTGVLSYSVSSLNRCSDTVSEHILVLALYFVLWFSHSSARLLQHLPCTSTNKGPNMRFRFLASPPVQSANIVCWEVHVEHTMHITFLLRWRLQSWNWTKIAGRSWRGRQSQSWPRRGWVNTRRKMSSQWTPAKGNSIVCCSWQWVE